MNREMEHHPDSEYAYPLGGHTLRLILKVGRGQRYKEVAVLWNNKYDFAKRRNFTRMRQWCRDAEHAYYVCDIESADVRFAYIFLLTEQSGREYYYSEEGVTEEYDFRHGYYTFFQYPFINAADVIAPVPWTKDAVVYQIFPDRYRRGDTEKDDTYITQTWEEIPGAKDFAGGDLKGIEEKLDEISGMGFTALYLTPVFRSPSNHKYNVTDYLTVDPMFGDGDSLRRLIASAHAHGLRVISDAVFNHCDEGHAYFADVKAKGKASEFYDWFLIDGDFPERYGAPAPARHSEAKPKNPEDGDGGLRTSGCFADAQHDAFAPAHSDSPRHSERSEESPQTKLCNYEIFADCTYMPKWNTSNPKVREYLIQIALTYLSWGIDGLRLDVADEVSHVFRRELRRAVKAEYPEALLIGEVWHESGMYLGGDEFDGVMNYKLQKVYTDYFGLGVLSAERAAERINGVMMKYRRMQRGMMLNFLDNHDTARFLRVCGEREANYLRGLAALYFTDGMPCVLYGTELPLTGESDPDCRRTYDWTRPARYAEELRKLSAMRRALPMGDFRAETRGGALVLVREDENERALAYFGGQAPCGEVLYTCGDVTIVKERKWTGKDC